MWVTWHSPTCDPFCILFVFKKAEWVRQIIEAPQVNLIIKNIAKTGKFFSPVYSIWFPFLDFVYWLPSSPVALLPALKADKNGEAIWTLWTFVSNSCKIYACSVLTWTAALVEGGVYISTFTGHLWRCFIEIEHSCPPNSFGNLS